MSIKTTYKGRGLNFAGLHCGERGTPFALPAGTSCFGARLSGADPINAAMESTR